MPNHPRKRFGQHWLRNDAILQQIVDAAEIQPSDHLLEIGPGKGVLTHKLLAQAESVVAVEVDRDLCSTLRKEFQQYPQFHLIEGDVLALDLETLKFFKPQLIHPHNKGEEQSFNTPPPEAQRPNKVVANIPYYITGPILEKLLGRIATPNPHPFNTIVLLIQREVAERVCAESGSKTFGALSVRVQYHARCDYICTVPSKAFFPPPKVESAVIRLVPRPFDPQATHPEQLETLVKVGFSTKRKMLRNNLKSLVERDRLLCALEHLAINPNVRAEEISTLNWVHLSNLLVQNQRC